MQARHVAFRCSIAEEDARDIVAPLPGHRTQDGAHGVTLFDLDINDIGDDVVLDPRLSDEAAAALEHEIGERSAHYLSLDPRSIASLIGLPPGRTLPNPAAASFRPTAAPYSA